MQSGRVFLRGLIDYAGLFPPASLGMAEAVQSYATYLAGPDHDLLGRFILKASQLGEFTRVAREILPRGDSTAPWRLSVIAGSDLIAERDAVLHFNCSHWNGSELGHAVCDAIEMPVADVAAVESALKTFPGFFQSFLEVSIARDPAPIIAAMSGTGAAGKMRTGGITENAIPNAHDVLRFIKACSTHRVPFKATAGLHHAVRASYPLTYDADAPMGEMLGYVNVFLAAAFLRSGLSDEDALKILEERDPKAFTFDEAHASWRGHTVSVDELERSRLASALSFGSCSFAEPVNEARALGII